MWKTVKLGEICNFEGGSQPPKKEFVYEPADGYVRFLQIRDFKSDKNITYIPIAKKNRLCAETDILIGRYGASVGQILSGLSGAYNVALMKTIPNKELISQGWLNAYLTSPLFQKPLMEVSSRSAQNGFSKDDIYDFDVPLPPLAEQQRIVAKLDAAFAEIDAAINLAKQKNENNSVLLNQFLATIKADTVKLDDIVQIKTGKLDANAMVEGGEYPFFTCSKQIYEIDKFAFDCDAVLLAGNNASGDFNVKHYIGKFNAYQRTYVITVKDISKLRSRYLYFQLIQALAKFKTMSVGTNTKFLKLGMIKDFEIPLPPIVQQDTILEKLQKIEQNLRVLEDSSSSQLSNYFALKSAILAKELQSEAA